MSVAPAYCLAVNCGSSSIKFKLYQAHSQQVVLAGSASNVQGSSPAKFAFKHVRHQEQDSTELTEEVKRELDSSTSYQDVFEEILRDVTSDDVLGDGGKDRIAVIAHRIVHGGTARDPVVIKHGDDNEQETLKRMDEVSDFAPLHNHHAMLIVKTCLESLPSATSVLCFDTLFHTTIPAFRTTYAISTPEHDTPVPLVRYGFHGLSYASILKQMGEELGIPAKEVNLVVAHLGSGGSCCLIQGGESKNTSMGLTPLEGLPGGTRSGSLDASLIFHHTPDCSETVEWSGRPISKAEFVLNKESGFKALTGTTDFGEITQRAFPDSPSSSPSKEQEIALLTYNLYLDRLLGFLSAYIATLLSSPAPHNKLHGLVFSGGIGEHSVRLRKDVLDHFRWVEELAGGQGGVDEKLNDEGEGRRRITKDGSRISGWVVETDEELECVQLAVAAAEQSKYE